MDKNRANRAMLKRLLLVVVVMFGFGYAMEPFYNRFCEAVGINKERVAVGAEADRIKNTQVDKNRTITVQFDTNVNQGMPWRFRVLTPSMKVHPGELAEVMFEATNLSDRPVTGQAIPSYGPALAGQHFRKIQCFCFNQETLQPHQTQRMPVQFVVLNTLPGDVQVITLSYTFFNAVGKGGAAAS